jgi:uncharacterized protein YoaH (UPF0181 family)
MIDPISAFALLKSGLSAGKQIASLGKEIAGFFDAVDGAKAQHNKKKTSIFASANEEAMDTFMTRGISQWRNLQNLRREIRVERKNEAKLAEVKAEERKQMILSGIGIFIFISLVLGSGGMYLWYLGWLTKW